MTAYAPPQQRPNSMMPVLLLSLVLLAVLVGIVGKVLLTTHATERHVEDAPLIRNCIQQKGAAETWRQANDHNVEAWLCQLADGRWCISIVQIWPSQGVDYRERTSFCPKDGTYGRVIRYLARAFERIR